MGDRLSDETDKAWQAFQDFRDMGTNRSIAELLKQYINKNDQKGIVPTTSNSTIRSWAFTNNWNERAREWDTEEEKRRLERLTVEKRQKWEKDVEDYRDKHRRLAAATFKTSLLLQSKVTELLESGTLTPEQIIKLAPLVPRYAETAASSEGTALGITQLLEEMDANK